MVPVMAPATGLRMVLATARHTVLRTAQATALLMAQAWGTAWAWVWAPMECLVSVLTVEPTTDILLTRAMA